MCCVLSHLKPYALKAVCAGLIWGISCSSDDDIIPFVLLILLHIP